METPIFYTVYETTNLVNGKTYIGKHQTKNPNDNYLGSGKLLKRAIEKYGEEWFFKVVLFVFDNEIDMNAKEAELVTLEFAKLETNYNLCSGGNGGFGYLNTIVTEKQKIKRARLGANATNRAIAKKRKIDANYETHYLLTRNQNYQKAIEKRKKLYPDGYWKGHQHTSETKLKMRSSGRGKHEGVKNSQYGTMWITDGFNNRKILKEEPLPQGWNKGRMMVEK